jgi:hypothetical protein
MPGSQPTVFSFDELVDLLRVRLGMHDALDPVHAHEFKDVMADHADVIADQWYVDAFEELVAAGHLDTAASGKAMGFNAHGRLSADGRLYLRLHDES